MTLHIELPEQETLALNAKAISEGIPLEEYARRVLEQDLAPEWLRNSWAAAKRDRTENLSMDEIDAEIAAARKSRRTQAI
jgi:hypothetical protein